MVKAVCTCPRLYPSSQAARGHSDQCPVHGKKQKDTTEAKPTCTHEPRCVTRSFHDELVTAEVQSFKLGDKVRPKHARYEGVITGVAGDGGFKVTWPAGIAWEHPNDLEHVQDTVEAKPECNCHSGGCGCEGPCPLHGDQTAPTDDTCPTCAKKPEEVNHPPGMIFVGWGTGWQTCPDCSGTAKRAPASDPPVIQDCSHVPKCRGWQDESCSHRRVTQQYGGRPTSIEATRQCFAQLTGCQHDLDAVLAALDSLDDLRSASAPTWDGAELTMGERQTALAAFREICKLVEHDSPAYCVASEQASWLASEPCTGSVPTVKLDDNRCDVRVEFSFKEATELLGVLEASWKNETWTTLSLRNRLYAALGQIKEKP